MNAERRKIIAAAQAKIEDARSLIEQARDDEQDYFDNMPEGFQNGDKGGAAQEAVSQLDDAIQLREHRRRLRCRQRVVSWNAAR
jgi:hypothetical protein